MLDTWSIWWFQKCKCVDASNLKRWLHFLVENIYLSFGKDAVLRQRIGIPMGTICAVFVVNLFCFSYDKLALRNVLRFSFNIWGVFGTSIPRLNKLDIPIANLVWFYCSIGEWKPGGFSFYVLRYCALHRWFILHLW